MFHFLVSFEKLLPAVWIFLIQKSSVRGQGHFLFWLLARWKIIDYEVVFHWSFIRIQSKFSSVICHRNWFLAKRRFLLNLSSERFLLIDGHDLSSLDVLPVLFVFWFIDIFDGCELLPFIFLYAIYHELANNGSIYSWLKKRYFVLLWDFFLRAKKSSWIFFEV